MHAFHFHKPSTLADAARMLADAKDGKLIAGGQTLLPTLKQRLAQPSDLIDLSSIPNLDGIDEKDGKIVIGAMARHAQVAGSATIRRRLSALAELAGHIGDPQVRNCGTLGGSIANSDPAADYPAAILALQATIMTNKDRIEADQYFTGMFETSLGEKDMITGVEFMIPERAAYMKFPNPASRYAIVGVFVAKFASTVRVAVTGAGSYAFRLPELEAALTGNFSSDQVEGTIKLDINELNHDIHASNEYRAHLVGVMAKRAVARALSSS